MSDLIDRQAAIDALRTCQTYLFNTHDPDKKISLESAEYEIEQLPSAEPERKPGQWVHKSKPLDFCTGWWYECSECGSRPPHDAYGHPDFLSNFCPNCGSDNGGKQDDSI